MIKYCDRCEQDRYVIHGWDIFYTGEGQKLRLDSFTCITCEAIVESEQVPIVYWVKTTTDWDTPVFLGPYNTWLDAFTKAKTISHPLVEIEEGLKDAHAENL